MNENLRAEENGGDAEAPDPPGRCRAPCHSASPLPYSRRLSGSPRGSRPFPGSSPTSLTVGRGKPPRRCFSNAGAPVAAPLACSASAANDSDATWRRLPARFPAGAKSRAYRRRFHPGVTAAEWNDWRWQIAHTIHDLPALSRIMRLSPDERSALEESSESAVSGLPLALTPYYTSLMERDNPSHGLRLAMVPRRQERLIGECEAGDPLGEENHTVAPGLIHRYPDRVLFLATETCAAYCRYCTRSRRVGRPNAPDCRSMISRDSWEKALAYIASTPAVRDVIISGGDPLTLPDDALQWLLARLRSIPHVEIIRVGTRVPAVLPQRVTRTLVRVLKKHHPLWMSLHFTHPDELTPESAEACERLADAGIPLGSQTVLLAGVNDHATLLKDLFLGLLRMRVRPYYLYQCDPIHGSAHFRTPVEKGLEIIRSLRGHTSGYAIPHYVIDTPGGGGKVALLHDAVCRDAEGWELRNYEGHAYRYPDPV